MDAIGPLTQGSRKAYKFCYGLAAQTKRPPRAPRRLGDSAPVDRAPLHDRASCRDSHLGGGSSQHSVYLQRHGRHSGEPGPYQQGPGLPVLPNVLPARMRRCLRRHPAKLRPRALAVFDGYCRPYTAPRCAHDHAGGTRRSPAPRPSPRVSSKRYQISRAKPARPARRAMACAPFTSQSERGGPAAK